MLGPGEFRMAACRYDAFFDGDAVYMALEFMDMGTLSTMIQVRPVYAHSVGLMGGGSPKGRRRVPRVR
jgi:hypothetical protein